MRRRIPREGERQSERCGGEWDDTCVGGGLHAQARGTGEGGECVVVVVVVLLVTLPKVPVPSVLPTRYSRGFCSVATAGREPMCLRHKSSDVTCEGTALPSPMNRSSREWSGARMHVVICVRERVPRTCSSSAPAGAVESSAGLSTVTFTKFTCPL